MENEKLDKLISESLKKILNESIKGYFWKDDNYYTYDHLLPKGTGENFTPQQSKMMVDAAKSDLQILKSKGKKGVIKKDDMNFPYLELKESLSENQKTQIKQEMSELLRKGKEGLEKVKQLIKEDKKQKIKDNIIKKISDGVDEIEQMLKDKGYV